jgi:hypothetical protein
MYTSWGPPCGFSKVAADRRRAIFRVSHVELRLAPGGHAGRDTTHRSPPDRPPCASPPDGGDWLHEMKHDGRRLGFRARGRKLKRRRLERGQNALWNALLRMFLPAVNTTSAISSLPLKPTPRRFYSTSRWLPPSRFNRTLTST